MAAPVWTTPSGEIGTIIENEFYQLQLEATNATSYTFLSGTLPDGIEVKTTGMVEGSPRNVSYISGVPTEIATDVTSRFVVRATSSDNIVADRIFELTVTGQDAPVISATPAADFGAYNDGDYVSVQLSATDSDPEDTLTWDIISGALPTGLSISSTGLISGYIEPVVAVDGQAGYDVTGVAFDQNPFDYGTRSDSKYFEFTARVSDGKNSDTKAYRIYVVSRNIFSADTNLITADSDNSSALSNTVNSLVSADDHIKRTPVLLTSANLGTITHNNNHNIQIIGRDFDGDPISFGLTSGALPNGLSLNAETGWITGTIPDLNATTTTFTFGIKTFKTNDTQFESASKTYTLVVEGDVSSVVTWPTTTDLTIGTGEYSQLSVAATISDARPVRYELNPATAQSLPQGLKLNEQGLIIGRVSFETMMFDTNTTTFDKNSLVIDETTFEHKYTFTVKVFSADGIINTTKQFTCTVSNTTNKPYESLYMKAHPTKTQRDIYESLIQNIDDIPDQDVYRATDFYYGIQRDLRVLVSTGLNPKLETDYVEAIAKNHYNTKLTFNGLKTARALESDGTTVKYEVVYVDLVDRQMGINPTTGVEQSVALNVDVRSDVDTWTNPFRVSSQEPKVDSGTYSTDSENIYTVYPNSIVNMRKRIDSAIGHLTLERSLLPEWMQDKQEDGKKLGWILAVPIVFCKPGTSKKIKYRLEQRTNLDLKKISFEVDRFILDNNLSKFYSNASSSFTLTIETTFDTGTTETTFDGRGTRFFANVDVYQEVDDGDKYIKFPQVGVFE
jgi:hypothetical protein